MFGTSLTLKRSSLWEDLRQTCIARLPLALRMLPRKQVPGEMGILMYHRIAPRTPGLSFPTSNVTPTRFREQLRGLLDRGYKPLPLRKLLDLHEAGGELPRKVFAVTFDDGYANNFTQALPILKELQVPATIFLATAYLDSAEKFPFENWDDASKAGCSTEDWRALTIRECESLLESGIVELGAHTHTHRDFRGAPLDFEADLQQCVDLLRSQFGLSQISFAFPYGKQASGFSGPELVKAARRTGVLCGLTSENELANVQHDPFAWGRLTASEYDTAATLAAKLDGVYGQIKRVWRALSCCIRKKKTSVPIEKSGTESL